MSPLSSTSPLAPLGPQRTPGHSLTQASGIQDPNIVRGTLDVSDRIALQVLAREQHPAVSLKRFIVGDPADNELAKANAEMVKRHLGAKLQAFDLATTSKMELASTAMESIIRETKIRHDARLAQMVIASFEELRGMVQATRETFLAHLDQAMTTVEKYAHRPLIADRAMRSIESEAAAYFDYLEQTTSAFLTNARHKLGQANPSANARPMDTTPGTNWNF